MKANLFQRSAPPSNRPRAPTRIKGQRWEPEAEIHRTWEVKGREEGIQGNGRELQLDGFPEHCRTFNIFNRMPEGEGRRGDSSMTTPVWENGAASQEMRNGT